jgi:hypothetical protein
MLRELRQELFSEMRSELLHSKQETPMVLQENAALQKRIEELESASVRASTPTSSPAWSTPASPANNTSPDQPAGSHLVDPVVSLRQLGDFTADEARWVLFQSNNIVDVAAEILLSGSPVPLLGFVLMNLNTVYHEVEGVAFIHLSLLGPRSRQIRFMFTNRCL